MNIVHLSLGITPVPPGDKAAGVEGYIYQLARHLAKLEGEVHVIDIKAGEQQEKARKKSGVTFHKVWRLPLPSHYNSHFLQHFVNYMLTLVLTTSFAVMSTITLRRLLKQQEINIIHTHGRETAIAASIVNRLTGKKARVIYTPQCPIGPGKLSWQKKLINIAEIPALKRADHVIAFTPVIKEWLVEQFSVKPSKITPIPVGIAMDEIEPFLLQRNRNGNQKPLIMCCGVVSERKNQLSAVKAAAKVLASHPKARFVFTGPIGQSGYLKLINQYIADNNLSNSVEFKGMVTKEELYNLYKDASIFLFPTTAEVQPTVLMEALAFGLPVVSSSIKPIADVVSKSPESAILVDPYDIDGMSAAITKLLEDNDLWQNMSEKAQRAAQDFLYDDVAAKTITLYAKLAKAKKGR